MIDIEEYILIDPALSYVFHVVLLDDMPSCIMDGPILPITTFENCISNAVQIICDVLTYVVKFFCFTSETISIIY
jgi:hypothetical protein